MAIEFAGGSVTADQLRLAVELAQIRREESRLVRLVASRWVDGVRALVGFSGGVGLLLAPFAHERLSGTASAAAGALLGLAFLLGSTALLLVMAAAYGTGRGQRRPNSLVELHVIRTESAATDKRRLRLGQYFAVAALLSMSAVIVLVWSDLGGARGQRIRVGTSDGSTICGELDPSSTTQLSIGHEGRARFRLDVGQVTSVELVESCD